MSLQKSWPIHWQVLFYCIRKREWDFPGDASGEEPTCQCRRQKRHGFNRWGWGDPLEKGMATHSSILAWRIPLSEEPSRLQPIGSQRVGHDWGELASAHTQSNRLWKHKLSPFLSPSLSPFFLLSYPLSVLPPLALTSNVNSWGRAMHYLPLQNFTKMLFRYESEAQVEHRCWKDWFGILLQIEKIRMWTMSEIEQGI